jgi:uncharacterized protein YqhQ
MVGMHTKHIGGQAVIEGVMMKSPSGWSVAVRDPKGAIQFKTVRTKQPRPFFKLPVVRGVVALGQALRIGVKAIEYSGSVAYEEQDKPMSSWSVALSIGLAIVLAIGLFKFLPLLAATFLSTVSPQVASNSFLFNLVDGVVRVAVFLFYVFAIGLWKEMRRIYEYHGAEHKVIYAYEAGDELSVENALKYRPFHPRCGTSFLLIVMVISILIFMLIPQQWSFLEKLLARLALLPLLAGVAYETLKLSARMKNNALLGIIAAPGLLLQRLTVREPDTSQIEVALAALQQVIEIEGRPQETA